MSTVADDIFAVLLLRNISKANLHESKA